MQTSGSTAPLDFGNRSRVGRLLLLTGLQIVVTLTVVATMLDLVIPGTIREAVRSIILDQPQQLAVTGLALILAAVALRATAAPMLTLVPEPAGDGGWQNLRILNVLPRLYPAAICFATAVPFLGVATDIRFGGLAGLLASTRDAHAALALGAGMACLAIGLAVACFPSVKANRSASGQRTMVATVLCLFPCIVFAALALACFGTIADQAPLAMPYFDRVSASNVVTVGAVILSLFGTALAAAVSIGAGAGLLLGSGDTAGPSLAYRPPAHWRGLLVLLAVALAALIGLAQIDGPALVVDQRITYLTAVPDWIGSALIPALAAILALVFVLLRSSISRFADGLATAIAGARAALSERGWLWIITYIVLFLVAAIPAALMFDLSWPEFPQSLGAVAIIDIWAALLLLLAFPFAYLSQWTRVPLVGLLIACAVLFSWLDVNDNHGVRYLAQTSANPAKPKTSRFGETLDITSWLATRSDLDAYDHYPVFIVATEGGGLRAAYVTASVLAALSDICPSFPQHVYGISAVSGGSVGAATFSALAADLAKPGPGTTENGFQPCLIDGTAKDVYRKRLREVFRTDLLSPLLAALLFPDALQRLLPFPIERFDRARAIEAALEHGWAKACQGNCRTDRMAAPLQELFDDKATEAAVPHLMLGTTEVETGAAVTVSTAYLFTPTNFEPGIDNADLLQFRDARDPPLALSTAAMVSARFPYLTPAARKGDNRYVDGGYFENSGTWLVNNLVQSVMDFKLWADPRDKRVEAALRKAQIIVISIRSTPGCLNSPNRDGCQSTVARAGGLGEAFSPLQALLNAGSGHATYSRSDLGNMVDFTKKLCMAQANGVAPAPGPANGPQDTAQQSQACVADDGYLAGGLSYPVSALQLGLDTVTGYDVPLTWHLSSASRALIDDAVNAIVTTDITGVLAPDDASDARHDLPSKLRRQAASAKAFSVLDGAVEPVLCALATQKGAAKDFRPWQVCNKL